MNTGRWLAVFVLLIFGIGLNIDQASAAVDTVNNNFTMLDPTGALVGGTNDVVFTWDGTQLTSVAASGQVSNATLSSVTPFFGVNWTAHDVAVYSPGTYTVYTGCAAGSPGCGAGTPITFTVAAGQLGVHMLFNWGGNNDIDVVDVWSPTAVFGPSPMWTGGGGSNPANTVWDWMSKDWDGDGVNGAPMVDGPFVGFNGNFNVMGVPPAGVYTLNNNFTLIDPTNLLVGGTNDVEFTWDGTKKTAVAASGQISNATLSSPCPFLGFTWSAHDVAIYGPGTYTVYADCPAGSPGCGTGTPITFTVGAGELGVHMLFNWAVNNDIDVVNVWSPNAMFAPSPMETGGCGSNPADKVWDWMSKDWNGDGINGSPMVDGPFVGFNANFNVMADVVVPPLCVGVICNDNDACTDDACDPATGNCVFTPLICNDNSSCTADTCDPAVGCVFTPVVVCNDNNACTDDTCDPATGGCIFTPVVPCNDNNVCTTDTCDPVTGCVYTAIECSDGNACTTDTCDPASGCVYTPISCDDNNPCTIDTCDPASGSCVNTPTSTTCIGTINNNFTMIDPVNNLVGGANDVQFTWDGTKKTSVECPQTSNATLTSSCPFFGITWQAHDIAIYGPGTYTVYDGCPAGCPSCGIGNPITFTVGAGELGVHILFNWAGNNDIDVVNVWSPNAMFAPSPMWTGGCGSNPADKVWDWMSKDVNGDGINGYPFTDGPFVGFNANFNVMGDVVVPPLCVGVICNDNDACTDDTCDPATGNCVYTPLNCNDNSACTADTCDPAVGCVFTPAVVCNDNNACTADTCDPATGGCIYTPMSCNDNNICTMDTCDPATGCVFTAIDCSDGDACTIDTCDPASGCVHTPISCDDNNPCTNDSCDPASGSCVNTPTGGTCIGSIGNNFTMIDPVNNLVGGANDVQFTWDGTKKTSVAASGQVSNATLSSTCPFFGMTWTAHDTAIYGPGTYTVYADCPAGSPGCALAINPITFTVGAGELGVHILFNWGGNNDIDVVNVWSPNAVFGPSPLYTGSCGSNPADKVWDWMSKDWDGDGINGSPMVDGPFVGFNTSFNVMGVPTCVPADCNDSDACTIDSCDPAAGCVHTAVVCDDGNACTTDSCDPATGCVHTAVVCDDGNACTIDSCDPATGCVNTAVVCDDSNECTSDSCDPATGNCASAPVADGTACTVNSAPGTCQSGTCVPACPAGSVQFITIRGGGQKPTTVDLQIQTRFTALGGGCITGYTNSTITVTPGTVLSADFLVGNGPDPSSGTWMGNPISVDAAYTITGLNAAGDSGVLIITNKDNGGKDTDRMTIRAQ